MKKLFAMGVTVLAISASAFAGNGQVGSVGSPSTTGFTSGACLDKVADAAIKQMLSEIKSSTLYAMTSASVINRFEGATSLEDVKQDIVIRFDVSSESKTVTKSFSAQANTKCEFKLVESK